MLTLKQILGIWRTGDYRVDVALDRHDCPEYRRSYDGPALPDNHVPKPGEEVIKVRLEYNVHGNIVQR